MNCQANSKKKCVIPLIGILTNFYGMLTLVSKTSYLDVTVEADSRVICAFQAVKGNRTLLLIVDEEDEDSTCEVQQHSYCGSFGDATIRSAQSTQKVERVCCDLFHVSCVLVSSGTLTWY